MPDRELGAALQAAQILEGEKPLTPIRTLYERYNQSQEAKKLDRLQREIDIWAQEPTQGGVDLQEILDQRHQAERAVKPLRDPIDEQNKDRYPQALGIPRAQLEDLVSQHRSVKEVYQSLRNRLFHWEQAVATTGLSLGSRETDALEVIRRFNEVVSGQVPDYKARNPQEVIATLRAELSAPFETTEPAVPAGSAPAEPPPAELGPLTSSTAPEPLEPAAKEPTAPATVEPQPLTPEQQAENWVREKLARENAKVEAGQKPKWGGKPDALIEFLKSRGVSESQIMRWGSTRCFDEAAKILGLERKSLPRAEAPGAEELEQLQERLDNLEQRVSQFEAENKILKEENKLLKKALTNPDTLTEEEKTRLAELKGVETPTKTAVDTALDELLAKYAPDKEKEGRGRVRGAVLPIVGAIGGGRVAQFAISALESLGKIPIPGFAAITAGVSSLGASAIRRLIGENAFSLWARYSHTEGGKGRLGKVVKLGQMFARGAERAVLQRALGLTGASQEVQALLALYDEQGNLQLPAQTELRNQMYVQGLVREGVWYSLGTEAGKQLGAYFTEQEQQQISANRPKVLRAVNELLAQNYIPAGQQTEFLQRVQQELINRERAVWTLEAGEVAAIGAAKALTLSQAGIWAAEHLAPKIMELLPQAGVRLPQAAAAEPIPTPPIAGLPPVEEAARTTLEHLPQIEQIKALEIHRTVGHTLVENNFKPDWGNLDIWQARLLANDTENPTLWENAAKMARAIAENPDKHLAGLSPETRNAALAAAQRTVAALQEAGYDEKTHSLTNAAAVLKDKQKILDLLHWVKNGQKYFEPVK